MKLKFLWVLLPICVSCQFFETERISSETFYEEEMQIIDWEDVDGYPAFPDCDESSEKEVQRSCFERNLKAHIYAAIEKRNLTTHQDLNHTILVDITISNTGEFSDVRIEMDSILTSQIPMLKQWLEESIDSLPKITPADKRGIPVETQFQLPIVLVTN